MKSEHVIDYGQYDDCFDYTSTNPDIAGHYCISMVDGKVECVEMTAKMYAVEQIMEQPFF